MKLPLIILPISISIFFYAEAKKDLIPIDSICSVAETPELRLVDINLAPEYFLRPFSTSNKIAIADGDRNYFVDLDTKEATLVAGNYDALPMPDEKFWVYPDGARLHFMSIPKGKNEPAKEFYLDKEMQGYYQSAGALPEQNGNSRYRIMIDQESRGFVYKDYEMDKSGKITPLTKSTPLCRNLSGSKSLPMLSKDGGKVAFLDNETNTTRIFEINSSTGDCTLKKDLGIKTGKVDFSYDGKSIAYHTVSVMSADNHGNNQPAWIKKPLSQMVSNAWVMDLKNGDAKQITHYNTTSALYPSFNKKGEILLRKFRDEGSTIVTIDPKKEKRTIDISAFSERNCNNISNFAAIYALGNMFKNICLKNSSSFDTDATSLLIGNLNYKNCIKLAMEWDMRKQSVLQSTKESESFETDELSLIHEKLQNMSSSDLKGVCPHGKENKGAVENKTGVLTLKSPTPISKIPLALNRCSSCHGASSALPINFENKDELIKALKGKSSTSPDKTLVNDMLDRIKAGSVPPPNDKGAKPLNLEEQADALQWLQQIKDSP